jgi:hypothetical protein
VVSERTGSRGAGSAAGDGLRPNGGSSPGGASLDGTLLDESRPEDDWPKDAIESDPADRSLAFLLGRTLDLFFGSVVLLAGCVILAAGLGVVGARGTTAFTYGGALDGILSQIGVTGPAAAMVATATAANVLAGAILIRLAAEHPFRSPSDLVLGGLVGAVIADTSLLFLLGSFGLFGWPELVLFHAAVFVGYAILRRRGPAWRLLKSRVRIRLRRPAAWWPLVLALWAGPVIVQLASPASPFMDILPNHVAPVEHVLTFGSYDTLITSPSPIYGPSRLMLGWIGTLGMLTTLTGLHAVLAEAAFATPLAILVALALRRAASAMFGGSASFWVLLTFPLTFTFLRIPDTRGTVLAFPLALYTLSIVAEELRVIAEWRPPPSFRPDLTLTFALAGSVFVHPLIGLFIYAAAAGALVFYPVQLGPKLIPALGGSLPMILGQALVMLGVDAPSWVGLAGFAAGVGVAFALAAVVAFAVRALSRTEVAALVSDWSFDTAETAGICRAALLLTATASLLRITQTHVNLVEDYPLLQIDLFSRLVLLTLIGTVLALLRPQRGWILLGCAVVAGCALWAWASLVGVEGLSDQAIHYEVPKGVEYWLPVMLALGGAAAISAIWRLRRIGPVKHLAVLGFLVVSLYPLTVPVAVGPVTLDTSVVEAPLADGTLIGEHRGAESLGISLREAETGYWDFFGYPDPRNIIDEPRQQVVDEIRTLESQGRIGPSTQILHIASDFQQWTSVPIGVFTGALETSISLDPILNIHTEGGRLLGFDSLAGQVASHPGYIVFEPQNLNQATDDAVMGLISGAGYREIWSNWQATIFEAG